MSIFVNSVSCVILFKAINIVQGQASYFLRKRVNIIESGIFAIQACYTIIIL